MPPVRGGRWNVASQLKTDTAGSVVFTQVGTPSTSPTGVTTANTTTTTGGRVLATNVPSAHVTITGTNTTLTLVVSRDGSAIASTSNTTTTSLSTSTLSRVTVGDPTWTIKATIGTTRDISSLAATVSRESRF